MYLPRSLISHLYRQLLKNHHPLSPPVLLLVALDTDSLCACRILTALLKRDFIPHKIQPVAGYGDLQAAGERLIAPMKTSQGGAGGVVICLGAGGATDLSAVLDLDYQEDGTGGPEGVEVWVMDSRRPWHTVNVFGGSIEPTLDANGESTEVERAGVVNGELSTGYKSGSGGIIVFDDGEIESELQTERQAYCALEKMPVVDDDGEESDESDSGDDNDDNENASRKASKGKKRKSWLDSDDEDDQNEEDERPRQRRRSNSV
jgi:cell division control protein 45